MAKIKRFGVIIPLSKQISQDEFKTFYKIKVYNDSNTIGYILLDLQKYKKDIKVEDLEFAEIINEEEFEN